MNSEKITQHIINWLATYAQKAGVKGFVVGISGGVDSAVVSTLCAQTGLDTLCLDLPIHQHQSHQSRAQKHIEWLSQNFPNVRAKTVNLTPVFDEFVRQVPPSAQNQMPLANTRARLRMTTLYYFAGLESLLVAGTGNKIEDFGVGFFTKYGDGGVDLSPIADLMKSQVYQLAQYLGVIPEILKAKPSDGLFADDLSDEDQIGATYDELEWAMLQTQAGKTPEDFTLRQAQVMRIYQKRHRANLHKMTPIPVCKIPEEYFE